MELVQIIDLLQTEAARFDIEQFKVLRMKVDQVTARLCGGEDVPDLSRIQERVQVDKGKLN